MIGFFPAFEYGTEFFIKLRYLPMNDCIELKMFDRKKYMIRENSKNLSINKNRIEFYSFVHRNVESIFFSAVLDKFTSAFLLLFFFDIFFRRKCVFFSSGHLN